jgi:hypothetical protein
MNIPLAKVAMDQSHTNNIKNYGKIIEDSIQNAILNGKSLTKITAGKEIFPKN